MVELSKEENLIRQYDYNMGKRTGEVGTLYVTDRRIIEETTGEEGTIERSALLSKVVGVVSHVPADKGQIATIISLGIVSLLFILFHIAYDRDWYNPYFFFSVYIWPFTLVACLGIAIDYVRKHKGVIPTEVLFGKEGKHFDASWDKGRAIVISDLKTTQQRKAKNVSFGIICPIMILALTLVIFLVPFFDFWEEVEKENVLFFSWLIAPILVFAAVCVYAICHCALKRNTVCITLDYDAETDDLQSRIKEDFYAVSFRFEGMTKKDAVGIVNQTKAIVYRLTESTNAKDAPAGMDA